MHQPSNLLLNLCLSSLVFSISILVLWLILVPSPFEINISNEFAASLMPLLAARHPQLL
jgi:hypothetical protein